MLIPYKRIIFEGPSKDYYAQAKVLAASGLDGYVRLVFADFEGAIFYRQGKPATGLQESGLWMALGEELVAPLENKATVADGTMGVYELPQETLDFFAGRRVDSTVVTEAEPAMPVAALLDYIVRERSACIFKAQGPSWTGYAYLGGGRVIKAAYSSGRELFYGDVAINALRRATDKATVAIFFLEGGAPLPEAPMPQPVEKPAEVPAAVPEKPAEAPAAERGEVTLKVATVRDAGIQLRHPSRQEAAETLEDRSVVWVSGATLAKMGRKEADQATLVLPGGRTHQVMLLKVDVLSGPGGLAFLPRKLRRRLDVEPGEAVTLKPVSTVVPRR